MHWLVFFNFLKFFFFKFKICIGMVLSFEFLQCALPHIRNLDPFIGIVSIIQNYKPQSTQNLKW